ncbi:MAG: GTP cyclohydrolase IIa [Candidatus Hadarchaeota archaeon]
MKKIQMTLVQLDNYGPWTVTPKPRPEAELQTLQAEILAELERQFGRRGALVFSTRLDNFLAITNGVSLQAHKEIMDAVNGKFPVSVSIGVGAAETPYKAQVLATLALQKAGSSRSPDRKGALAGDDVRGQDEDLVQIAHMDVNHSTLFTDSEPIYDTHLLLQRTNLALMTALAGKDALVFYTGGDNFMAASNGVGPDDLAKVFSKVKQELGIELKAGVGIARTAAKAAQLASEELHQIRKGNSKGNISFRKEV